MCDITNFETAKEAICADYYNYARLSKELRNDWNIIKLVIENWIGCEFHDFTQSLRIKSTIRLIEKNCGKLQLFWDHTTNDDLVSAALVVSSGEVTLIPIDLRYDTQYITKLVTCKGQILLDLEPSQINNEVIVAAVLQCEELFSDLPDETKSNKEIILALVSKCSEDFFAQLPKKYFEDFDVALASVKRCGVQNLKYFSKFWDDVNVVYSAVIYNGRSLQYASDILRDNEQIVIAAVQNQGDAIQYAGKALQNDRDVVMALVRKSPILINYVPEIFRGDYGIMIVVVKSNGKNLKYASKELQNNHRIVSTAVYNHKTALKYASKELQNDRSIVSAAVLNYGTALQYAGEELRNDRSIVSAAVKSSMGKAIQYASPALRDDYEINFNTIFNINIIDPFQYISSNLKNDFNFMLRVVSYCGEYIQYASRELQSNKQIVLAAVVNSGYALKYVNNPLSIDIDVVIAALRANACIEHVNESLFKNPEFIHKVLHLVPNLRGRHIKLIKCEILVRVLKTCPVMDLLFTLI